MACEGLLPDVFTYGDMINVCEKRNTPEQAWEFFQAPPIQQHPPSLSPGCGGYLRYFAANFHSQLGHPGPSNPPKSPGYPGPSWPNGPSQFLNWLGWWPRWRPIRRPDGGPGTRNRTTAVWGLGPPVGRRVGGAPEVKLLCETGADKDSGRFQWSA